MSTLNTKALARLARLDDEIATLHGRITEKLATRRQLLAAMVADGDRQQADLTDQVRTLAQASNLANTGRVLTAEQVREIRQAHKNGESQGAIARRYGLAQPSVHKIVHRLSYRDVA